MDRAFLKVIKFNNSDVIATSAPSVVVDINGSETPLLWLDAQSVANYNAMYTDDINLQVRKYQGSVVNFAAYSGTKENGVFVANPSAPPKTTPSEWNTVAAGDKAAYKLIHDWLYDLTHFIDYD